MKTSQTYHYDQIAQALKFLEINFKEQPSLEVVANHLNMSLFHFQRLFSDFAGVSPKKFLQFLNINYAKQMLKNEQHTLFTAAFETGLSSTSRLHDLFVKIEGMTPAEYKNGAQNLAIYYQFNQSVFGQYLIASTQKGICFLMFNSSKIELLAALRQYFPNAIFQEKTTSFHQKAALVLNNQNISNQPLNLHLKGTDFQIKVWEALLKIPEGNFTTYGKLAENIGNAKASRAVGTAIGSNPIAFIIPCHRVIQSSGKFGQYRWGSERKAAILGWEAAKQFTHNSSLQNDAVI
ncbi:MAG: methylated-DNA--[protein]-cysteine S-methyltransferase [Candidatus Methylacidiphilales bacterium]